MGLKECIKFGTVTLLISVPGLTPLSLTGTIVAETEIPRHHHDHEPVSLPKKEKEIEVTEQETFLIVRVTSAILPVGFPLTIAQLTAENVAVNLDYVIMILPVVVS